MSVEVKELKFTYGSGYVLNGVSFQVKEGQLLSILGTNGVGKSTLLRCILGLLRGYEGSIKLNSCEVRTLSAGKISRLAAYIPQLSEPSFDYKAEDVVLMGTTSSLSILGTPGEAQRRRTRSAMETLGIEHLAPRPFSELSGGERQLVTIARALAQDTNILMLDEPCSGLDPGRSAAVMKLMRSLADKGYTIIQTTHDPELAYLFSDRVIALKDGLVLAEGTPQEVITAHTVRSLYGDGVTVESVLDGTMRVCVPSGIRK